jgi:hypothetical protein
MPDEKQKQSSNKPQQSPPLKPTPPPDPRPAPIEHHEWAQKSANPDDLKK